MSDDKSKTCLVIIFNHRYDKNISKLRQIYGERFSDIRFLMPFYDGDDPDVIPVYESSYQFQGFFIQAYEKLKNISCTHYLFIADDLIINPRFNEYNFVDNIPGGVKYLIKSFKILNSPSVFRWKWTVISSRPFYNRQTEWQSSLPTYEKALAKFHEFFQTQYPQYYTEEFFGDPNKPGNTLFGTWNDLEGFQFLKNKFIRQENRGSLQIPYPMAYGYSDIFCIKKESLFEFSRLCGIFSAMNLFVEISIPTAAVLTFNRNEVKFFGDDNNILLWSVEDRNNFAKNFNYEFKNLCSAWNENLIFVHPIKLSNWRI